MKFTVNNVIHFLVLFLKLSPCGCDINFNCITNSIKVSELLLRESDIDLHPFRNIDVVLSTSSNKTQSGITEILEINRKALKISNAFSSAWNIEILEKNDGSMLVLFPCFTNETEFVAELTNVVTYFHLSQLQKRGRLWSPIFVFLHPKIFNNTEQTEQNALILHELITSVQINTFREIYSIRGNIINQIVEDNTDSILSKRNLLHQLVFRTNRRSNFQKSTVIAIGIDDVDYPLATEFKPNTTELIGGFEVEVYHYFRDSLNFSELAIKGIGYVREGPNGTLTGYSVQLNNELGDVAIGAGEFLEYRVKGPDGITYVHPIFHAHVIAYFKQPPASSIRNIFTQTFTLELWISSLAIWTMIVFALRISAKLVRRNNGDYNPNPRDERIAEESIIWAAGAMCQQGWHTSPYSTPVKIVFFCGIFTGLISYIAYSAALVSILAVEVVPIREFQDLITEKFYIASDSHIPTAKVIVKDLEDTHKISKLADGVRNVEIEASLEKMFRTRFALVTIPDSFYPVIQQNYANDFICNTVATKIVSPRPLKSSCFLKRGSHLREFFNYKLLLMQERGVKFRMIKEYVYGTSVQCLQSSGSVQLQLGLRDLFTAFGILVFGLGFSLTLVFAEKLYSVKIANKTQ